LGVAPDREQAERHYRSAAQHDHESAQLALADLIAERAASAAQWRDAMHWYQQAAEHGNAAAQARLTEISARQPTSERAGEHTRPN
jgi:TPR repeat protein